jgi:hypothetical protein
MWELPVRPLEYDMHLRSALAFWGEMVIIFYGVFLAPVNILFIK